MSSRLCPSDGSKNPRRSEGSRSPPRAGGGSRKDSRSSAALSRGRSRSRCRRLRLLRVRALIVLVGAWAQSREHKRDILNAKPPRRQGGGGLGWIASTSRRRDGFLP